MGERAAEPGLGALDRGRKVDPERQSRRDCCRERAAGSVKSTGDELDGSEHTDLSVEEKQIAASVSPLQVTALDQNRGCTKGGDPFGGSAGVIESTHGHLGQQGCLLRVRCDQRGLRDDRVFVGLYDVPG